MGALEPTVLNILQPEWMTRADCQNLPTDIFFLSQGASAPPKRNRLSRSVDPVRFAKRVSRMR